MKVGSTYAGTSPHKKKIMYKVLLLADHKWRDLAGLVAVKVHLEDQFGISAYIIPPACFETAMAKLQPHMAVLHSMNGPRLRYMAHTAKQMGALVAILPTEGRPQENGVMQYVTGQLSDLTDVDLWMNWSETVNDLMVSQKVLSAEKAKVIGVPRFDFYRDPLRSLLMSRKQLLKTYGLMPDRPVISWATNFVIARHIRTNTLDFLVKDFKQLGVDQIKTYQDPKKLAEKDLEVRLRSLEVFKEICFRFPDVNFILRPHPFEDTVDYEACIKECRSAGMKNGALITNLTISDILNAVDIHIHRLCTTGIEAWVYGLPSIDFHLEDYGGWDVNLEGPATDALAGNDMAQDLESLTERIHYYLRGGKIDAKKLEARESYIKKWFYRIDGLSSQRCAEEIAKCLESNQPKPKFRLRHLRPKGMAKIILYHLMQIPYDSPMKKPKLVNGVFVDALGQADKIVHRDDVKAWSQLIRKIYTQNPLS